MHPIVGHGKKAVYGRDSDMRDGVSEKVDEDFGGNHDTARLLAETAANFFGFFS